MGTNYVLTDTDESMGIIPRAVKDIFNNVGEDSEREILVKASFIEVRGFLLTV